MATKTEKMTGISPMPDPEQVVDALARQLQRTGWPVFVLPAHESAASSQLAAGGYPFLTVMASGHAGSWEGPLFLWAASALLFTGRSPANYPLDDPELLPCIYEAQPHLETFGAALAADPTIGGLITRLGWREEDVGAQFQLDYLTIPKEGPRYETVLARRQAPLPGRPLGYHITLEIVQTAPTYRGGIVMTSGAIPWPKRTQ